MNRSILSSIRSWIDPFELLYLAISIATFSHTQWAAAFLFEGAPPTDDLALREWYLRGALIAIAVDVGMFLAARFLTKAATRTQKLTLIASFAIAAVISFYTQVVYILLHTPVVTLSAGVSGFWTTALAPLVDARVVILPLALPVLGTVYTLARLSSHVAPRDREVASMVDDTAITVSVEPARTSNEPHPLLTAVNGIKLGLMENEGPYELGCYVVDVKQLTFCNTDTGRIYGPYKTRSAMLGAMTQAAKVPFLTGGNDG